jgi:deoxyribose-phosphate aldolase
MNKEQFGKVMENRIFDMDFNYATVSNLCYEAKEFNMAAVQVFPTMINMCKEVLEGSDVKIAIGISYPHGGLSPQQKVFEIKDAIAKGANEVEICFNSRETLSENYDFVLDEFKTVIAAVPKGITSKIMIETEWLKDDMIAKVTELVLEAGADYIITSTGLWFELDKNKNDVGIKTTVKEIKLIKSIVKDKVKIQAQGNIDSAKLAIDLLNAGADRISTRFAAKIMREYKG